MVCPRIAWSTSRRTSRRNGACLTHFRRSPSCCAGWGCLGRRRGHHTRWVTPRRARLLKKPCRTITGHSGGAFRQDVATLVRGRGQRGPEGPHRSPLVHRGQRPPGRCDKRFQSTYIFAAVRPTTDDAFALVLPDATAGTMDLFLAEFANTLPKKPPSRSWVVRAAGKVA